MEVPPTKAVDGGNVYLPDATSTRDKLIENPKLLADSKPQQLTIIPLQENFRFPSSDSLLIKDCLLLQKD